MKILPLPGEREVDRAAKFSEEGPAAKFSEEGASARRICSILKTY